MEIEVIEDLDDDEWVTWGVWYVWAGTFGCWWVPMLGVC